MKVSRNNRILIKLNYELQQCDGEEDVNEKEIQTEFLYVTNQGVVSGRKKMKTIALILLLKVSRNSLPVLGIGQGQNVWNVGPTTVSNVNITLVKALELTQLQLILLQWAGESYNCAKETSKNVRN